jgi:hypothetical protein
VRIVVAGDSTAEATGAGVVGWAAANPTLAQAELAAERGCGFVRGGEWFVDDWADVPSRCGAWLDEDLPVLVRDTQPDVVGLMTTSWDVLDRRWPDEPGGATTATAVAARVEADLTAITQRLLDEGAGAVAWVREPIPDPLWLGFVQTQEDPARHAVLYAVMDRIAERFPGRAHVIDLPAHLAATGLDVDQVARPDGVHWTPEAATLIATDYLGEQLIRAALDLEPQ